MKLINFPVDPNPPANLDAALERSVAFPIFLVELTAGYRAFTWQPDGGDVYIYNLYDYPTVVGENIDEIVGIKYNGVSLVDVGPTGTLVPGSFKWAATIQRVEMIAPGSVDPVANNDVVVLFAMFRFSSVPADFDGKNWRTWILGLPALRNQVNANFSGISQIGGGTLTLQNENHFFDKRAKYNWDAGRMVLYMGASGLSYSEFKPIATWVPSTVLLNDKNFVVTLREAKVLIDTFYPSDTYDLATYPNLDPAAVGEAIPVAYGVLHGITPVLIDTAGLVFKVAGHAIRSFDGVRVFNSTTEIWETKSFASVNATLAEFTMSPLDFAVGATIVVDISGKKKANGRLMTNPAHFCMDVIQSLGQAVDTMGFALAAAWYDIGYRNNDPDDRVVVLAPSLYLNSQAKALSTLTDLMTQVRAYLTTNEIGEFTMIPFRNYRVSELPTLNDASFLAPGLVMDGSGTSNFTVQGGSSKVSKVQVNFDIREAESLKQIVVYSKAANRYTRNLEVDVPVVVDSLFTNPADASFLAQALVNEWIVDPYIYSGSVKWKAFRWRPGLQHVHVVSARHNLDVVLEVLQVQIDLTKKRVQLTFGNLRGFQEASGFWVDDDELTPAGASLAWPAGGQLSDPEEGQYRRHQAGHWHAEDDFALVMPYFLATNPSDKDHAVSRWQ